MVKEKTGLKYFVLIMLALYTHITCILLNFLFERRGDLYV